MFERYDNLRVQSKITHADVSRATGIPASTFSDWKKGKSSPKHEKMKKLAEFFHVSVDYLMGTSDDPSDYEYDGDNIAEVPQAYIDAANGDKEEARAIMLADAQKRRLLTYSEHLGHFSAEDAELVFALWGDTDVIDEKDVEDVRRFAAFIKEKKQIDDNR